MPFQYSFEEKTEMLLIFGECGRDATLAAETYAAKFPQNRAPNHQIFKSLVSSLRERGTFQQSTKSFINPTITHDRGCFYKRYIGGANNLREADVIVMSSQQWRNQII
jgi:hypothetical protein